MPMHQGFLPREGWCADVVLRLIRRTALSPSLLLPLILLARYTKRGQDLSVLHPTAVQRLWALFYFALARRASNWLSEKVRNNWTDDKYDWTKEIVLITGGSAGIGACIVRFLDELGITVVVLDVQPVTYTVSSNVHYFLCDIRLPENVMAAAVKIRSQVGEPTVIINNAGVVRGKTILDSEPGDVRFTFDVNTLAQYWIAKAFLPSLVAHNHGMVVTVASIASYITAPNMVDYSATKAAALVFHEGLTTELKTHYNAPKVRTVVIHPGHTRTPLFDGFDGGSPFLMPQQEPETIAEAVVKQVLSGRSGQIFLSEIAKILCPALRAFPDWHSYRVRTKTKSAMSHFVGRQVVKNVNAVYEGKESQSEPSESTVLVSEVSI